MSSRGMYLIGMLVILFLANICMLMGLTNWPQRGREGFAAELLKSVSGTNEGFEVDLPMSGTNEGFLDMLVQGKGSSFGTAPIGTYDGVETGKGAYEGWRGHTPNEPLIGPNVDAPGPDNLFIFKNNQCKPECCGASLSCDGGCVCTTPAQRNLINSRGGNRTLRDEF